MALGTEHGLQSREHRTAIKPQQRESATRGKEPERTSLAAHLARVVPGTPLYEKANRNVQGVVLPVQEPQA
jgi:hypothetical protein